MAKVRAGVFPGDGTYEVREFPLPEPPEGGAVLKVEACGLCSSDLAQLHGDIGAAGGEYPVVPGHEIVGRVHALGRGSEALGVREGDRVCVDTVGRCGTCVPCKTGQKFCERMHVYGYTPLAVASGLFGGYGEYLVAVPNSHLIPIRSQVPSEEFSLFEPLANAASWVEVAGVHPGDSVVIQGPGHQGLCVLAMVLLAGASQAIVTGCSNDGLRFEAARALGATATIDIDREDAVERVQELTGGGADVVMDIATAPAALPQAMQFARRGGRIELSGYKHAGSIEGFDPDVLVDRNLSILSGTGATPANMRRAVELIDAGRIDTKTLLGEVFSLDSFGQAVELLARRIPGRDAVRVGLRHN